MLNTLRKPARAQLSIDLGTANTLIYAPGVGIVLNEPSVVAVRNINGQQQVEAVGAGAKDMLGRTPANITAIRPLKDGIVVDCDITEKMLEHFIGKVHQSRFLRPNPRVLICVPCKSTQVERRAITDAVLRAGARQVRLVEEPIAAAIGAGIDISEAVGSMVVDIGGGTTEVAIISLNGVVYSDSLRIGGDRFGEDIARYVERNLGVFIGEATVENIKHTVGCAYPGEEMLEMDARGRNVDSGVPCSITINSDQTLEALRDSLQFILDAIKQAAQNTPPELIADIAERGIVLTGGGALLHGMRRLISEESSLPAIVAEDPLTCVARGAGMALEFRDKARMGLLSSYE